MKTFKTDRSNTLLTNFKEWLVILFFYFSIIIFDIVYPNDIIKDNHYFIALTLIAIHFLRSIYTERLQEIQIDYNKRQIIFKSKSVISKTKHTFLSFDNGRLEVERNKTWWFIKCDSLILYFLKNNTEIFEIKNSKDGFSLETLEEVYKSIHEISLTTNKS